MCMPPNSMRDLQMQLAAERLLNTRLQAETLRLANRRAMEKHMERHLHPFPRRMDHFTESALHTPRPDDEPTESFWARIKARLARVSWDSWG